MKTRLRKINDMNHKKSQIILRFNLDCNKLNLRIYKKSSSSKISIRCKPSLIVPTDHIKLIAWRLYKSSATSVIILISILHIHISTLRRFDSGKAFTFHFGRFIIVRKVGLMSLCSVW